jgi:hypothetical protein
MQEQAAVCGPKSHTNAAKHTRTIHGRVAIVRTSPRNPSGLPPIKGLLLTVTAVQCNDRVYCGPLYFTDIIVEVVYNNC